MLMCIVDLMVDALDKINHTLEIEPVVKYINNYKKHKGVDIKVSEQLLVRKGRKSTVTVFKGVFVMLDFDKPFVGKTIVQRKYKYNLFFLIIAGFFALNVICSLFSDFSFVRMCKTLILLGFVGIVFFVVSLNKNNKEEVKLEDVVFSKKWNVYATDQIEARYLLTTAFMERILEVKRRFKGMNIEFSFFDNKLLIAIPSSKDMFETTSLFKSALSYYRMQNVVYQFYSIFSIIDLLKIKGNQKDESK